MMMSESVSEVDVLEWYGQAPDRKEIQNVIEAAHDSGLEVVDRDFQGTVVDGEQHYVLILYLSRVSSPF